MKTIRKIMIALVAVIVGLGAVNVGHSSAFAATDLKYDATNVLDDLMSSDSFDIRNYPYDTTGVFAHPEIINVVEYCYSAAVNMRENYGVYLYFYNPQSLNLDVLNTANRVMIATNYNDDGMPNDYKYYPIRFLSKSEGDYKNLFYKFKVVDTDGEILKRISADMVAQQKAGVILNDCVRRYDLSGVELLTYGNTNATEYTIGGTYKFQGFSAGYGADIDGASTLRSSVNDLETIAIDLAGISDGVDKRTFWRSNSSSAGKNHQNQINSVFFAIDKTVLEKFGYILQAIKAQWWEYRTRPIIVIDNQSVYNDLLPYVGRKIDGYEKSRNYSMYYYRSVIGSVINYGWSWNADLGTTPLGGTFSDDIETILPLLFYTNGIDVDDYTLNAETLEQYFRDYDKSYHNGHLTFPAHDFSADLFDDEVDTGRTYGENNRVFNIDNPDDFWNLASYSSNHNWWDKLWDYGFGGSITLDDDFKDIEPIKMLTPEDMSVSDLSTHLKVNADDTQRLKDYYNSVKNTKEVFLFRYAATDYFSTCADVYDITNEISYNVGATPQYDNHIANLCQSTQFFYFDILEFTFNRDGVYTVIPVVSSPIDHWSDLTPPINPIYSNWWRVIFAVVLVVLILILLQMTGILPLAIQIVGWIIMLPFKLLGAIFKGIGNLCKSRRKGNK